MGLIDSEQLFPHSLCSQYKKDPRFSGQGACALEVAKLPYCTREVGFLENKQKSK